MKRSIHATARWLHRTWKRTARLQAEEIALPIEAIATMLEHSIQRVHGCVIGLKQNAADPCVYIRTADTVTVVAVYVDDLIVIAKTALVMQQVKESLTAQFKMKDMGQLNYCLGISIEQDENLNCLWIHHKQYFLKMLDKYALTEAKIVATPADVSTTLQKG